MVFNATFNNSSVISWRSVLVVEETAVPRENHENIIERSTIKKVLILKHIVFPSTAKYINTE